MSSTSSKTTLPTSITPLIAGFTGGVVSTTLLYPLDVIKARLQVSEQGAGLLLTGAGKRGRLGSYRVLRGIIKYEGIQGLYSGLIPALVGSAVSWGGYFYFYEAFKLLLVNYKLNKDMPQRHHHNIKMMPRPEASKILNSLDNFVLACAAGGVMVVLTNPIWLIKTRMQLQMRRASQVHNLRPYLGMIDATRTIVREEGYLALYRGSGPAFLLTSHGGVQFVVYEYLRKHFHYQRGKREESNSVWELIELSAGYLAMGSVSKVIASTVTYPLQVIKSRLQQRSQSLELTSDGEVHAVQREYRGMITTAQKIWSKEGIAGFFKGAIPNAIRVAPGAAITFVTYEFIVDWLK